MQIRKFWNNNSLSIVTLGIFAAILVGMSLVGWRNQNNELADHQQPAVSYGTYITSGEFVEGVFENWESEYLQMWALVVLTIYLRQKGSSESKRLRGKMEQDTSSRYSILRGNSRAQAFRHGIYAHSLGIVLFSLFLLFFIFHAMGGTAAHNSEALLHGGQSIGVWRFITTAEFWYQSLQNWQSEFLAVGSLLLLTIHLRERGSEQSKPVGRSHDSRTGP